MAMKSIVISNEKEQRERWFDNEKQAIEFMKTMKNEPTYFEDETQIYVEKEGVSYQLNI